ncbi:neuronal acetylcholine receptor subunit alpha-6-like [Clytia hemisphaerica]|uniref:Uncharacterized protein n=1 Tax=Clytia hemisphaerica TaxID=252671 RepID=A0A7M6DPK9_9CNID
MKKEITFVFIIVVLLDVVSCNDAELRLFEKLFTGYNNKVRPINDKSKPVNTTLDIAYVQLVQLDDREQTLISNVWVRQNWQNDKLTWDPKDFDNITVINVHPSKVWLPDVILYNNAKSGVGAGMMYRFKTKVSIFHNGLNKWYAPAIVRSSCSIDIKNFPFDEQKCDLEFGSWTYNGYELDLFYANDKADTSFYLASAEFDLISAKAKRFVKRYECCPEPYPNIIYTVHVRRQPGFFLFNVIIPSMVITFFAILTFSSPPNVGERISLAIESFLSLSFLCMMVADSIPVNSDVSPLITNFLMVCMMLISLALVFNMISMNLTGTKPVPRWLHTLAFVYIGPLVGYCRDTNATTNSLGRFFSSRVPSKIENKVRFMIHKLHTQLSEKKLYYGEKMLRHLCRSEHCMPQNREEVLHEEERQNMRQILKRSSVENNQKFNRDFWRCIAQTVDRVCVVSFSTSFLFVSAAVLMKGYGHQLELQK